MIAGSEPLARSCSENGESSFRLVLLRHAETGLHGRFCGHSDPELNEKGRNAIPAIIARLGTRPPSAIWCSDLARATETASAIAQHFGIACRPSPSLREMNFGLWEGLTWKEVEARFSEDARLWVRRFPHHRPPGGESFPEFQSRVIAEFKRLAADVNGVSTLVVTHAGVIRVEIAWILGVTDDRISRIEVEHGAAVVLQKTGEYWSVCVSHSAAYQPSSVPVEDCRV